MNWIALHHGPHGIHSRFTTPEWVQAANWLHHMMIACRASRDILTRLASAPPATPFTVDAGCDLFQIRSEPA